MKKAYFSITDQDIDLKLFVNKVHVNYVDLINFARVILIHFLLFPYLYQLNENVLYSKKF